MKKLIVLMAIGIVLYACSSNNNDGQNKDTAAETSASSMDVGDYDPKRGLGEFDHVEVGPALDQAMATQGETIANLKCASCHKYSDEKLVGPGWSGVTNRHELHWIMNFITNPDEMIDKDPELQAQLELCLVRMPNQNLTNEDARAIVEFMRKNDGVK